MKLLDTIDDFHLTQVVLPDGWQDHHQEERIRGMVEDLQAGLGEAIPPLILDENNVLVDGRNRYEALMRAGRETCRVDIVALDPGQARKLELITFLHRKQLTPDEDRRLTRELHELLQREMFPQPAETGSAAARSENRAAIQKQAAMRGVSEDTVERKLRDPKPAKQLDVRMPDGSRYEPESPLEAPPPEGPFEEPAPAPPVELPKAPHLQALHLLKASLDILPGITGNVDRAEGLVGPMFVKSPSGGRPPAINGIVAAVRAVQAKLEMCRSDLEYAVRELNGIEAALRRTNEPSSPDEPLPGERRAPKTGLRGRKLR